MIIEIGIVVIYFIALLLIFLYALAQLNLMLNYLRADKKKTTETIFDFSNAEEVPFVTIQLPVYNELYVIERLLNNTSRIIYPAHKLEIQVLDDSTDESLHKTAELIKELKSSGLNIYHITRKERKGFKAGALKKGLKTARGEFIAIFDADFLPGPDWLLKTVPYFKDHEIGMVQTRWGHINRNFSLLTKIQAFALDFHFVLEQVGRNFGNHFINFNGTAGVWRKSCILDAGNWQGDTLTEDLDLSYRAQLKNWKFKYLVDVETPAELPVVISAAKSQQFRWNKGAAENFQKLFATLLKNPAVSAKTKFHSFFHLLNSSMFLLILAVAVLSVPMLYIKAAHPEWAIVFYILAGFAFSTVIFFLCYWITYSRIHGSDFKNFLNYIGMFFIFFSVAMGFSVHNSVAVLEGHFGKKSEFVRTPKFNISNLKQNWKNNKYLTRTISLNTLIEGILMLYFAFGMYSAFIVGKEKGDFRLFPFHLMLFMGFAYVFFKSFLNRTQP